MMLLILLFIASLDAASLRDGQYEIIIHTGTRYWSGTDANPFIELYGSTGDTSGKIQLNTRAEQLNLGSIDSFVVDVNKNLGSIEKIALGHDNSGKSAGWFVEHVEINTFYSSNHKFIINSWLDDASGYKTTLVASAFKAIDCGTVASPRIINGATSSPNKWPWQASIGYYFSKERDHCGGTLIHPQYVLTAAHCLWRIQNPTMYAVTLGQHDLSRYEPSEQKIYGAERILHPGWDILSYDSDIALLKLDKPAILNNQVKVACLPKEGHQVSIGKVCHVTGWGKVIPDVKSATKLQEADLPVVTNKQCHYNIGTNSNGYSITENMLCAGRNGKGTCHGDSGGPFVCLDNRDNKYVLHGITSWSKRTCEHDKYYSVFTRVANYIDWIDSQLPRKITYV